MSTKRTRRRHTAEQKAELLRRHLVDKVPVSDLCDAEKLQPSLVYEWQRQLFARAAVALETKTQPSREKELEAENAALRAKLQKKDEVIAEVTAEYVNTKKELGEL